MIHLSSTTTNGVKRFDCTGEPVGTNGGRAVSVLELVQTYHSSPEICCKKCYQSVSNEMLWPEIQEQIFEYIDLKNADINVEMRPYDEININFKPRG